MDLEESSALLDRSKSPKHYPLPLFTNISFFIAFVRCCPLHRYVRTADGTPIGGVMLLDTDDVAQMQADGTWEPVLAHEMGHW